MNQEIIKNKDELNDWLDYERERYGIDKSFSEHLKYLFGAEKYVIWEFQQRLRITEYYFNSGKKIRYLFSAAKLNRLRNKYSLKIGLNICGKGLKIMHLGSILMNSETRIGEDCSLHINTAFVASGVNGEAPEIGSGVVVGVGAVVVGGVKVANNVAIGANSVVCKSINEEDIAVAGAPAKKVSDNGRTRWSK